MKKLFTFTCLLLVVGFYWLLSCRVVQSQTSSVTMTRKWTAPGDDGFIGQAVSYQAKWSIDSLQLKNNWDACVSCAEWTGITAKGPAAGGAQDSIRFTGNYPTGVRLYFGIRALDEVGNRGAVSNIWDTLLIDGTSPARIADLH